MHRSLPDTDLLFVYGSLLSSARHAMGARLRTQARLIAVAAIPGRLYRVSWYPAALYLPGEPGLVHGEVYRLVDPAETLAWLDVYEAITPGPCDGACDNDYERVIVPVRLGGGNVVRCWMYVWRRGTVGLELIISGRWTT